MSDRRVRDVLKTLCKFEEQKEGKLHAEAISRVSQHVGRLLKYGGISAEDRTDLIETFSNNIVDLYDAYPAAALRLAGEVIAFVVDIKLATATSDSGDFEDWLKILDRGLISGIQAYQEVDHHDQTLLGKCVFPSLTKLWKSEFRNRLPLELVEAIINILIDATRKNEENAKILLDVKVLGSDQIGAAIVTTYDALVLESAITLVAMITHALPGEQLRVAASRDIWLSRPVKTAFGVKNAKEFYQNFNSIKKNKFLDFTMSVMQFMAANDLARPQLFKATNIIGDGEHHTASIDRPSLMMDQNGLILNTTRNETEIATIVIDFSILQSFSFLITGHQLNISLQLTSTPKLLSDNASQISRPSSFSFEVSVAEESRVRDVLHAHHQSHKLQTHGSHKTRKQPRSSKTEAIQLFPNDDRSSDDGPVAVEKKREELAKITEANMLTSPARGSILLESKHQIPLLSKPSEPFECDIPALPAPDHLSQMQTTQLPAMFDCHSEDSLSDPPSPSRPHASLIASSTPLRNTSPRVRNVRIHSRPSATLASSAILSDDEDENDSETPPPPKKQKTQALPSFEPVAKYPKPMSATDNIPVRPNASRKKYRGTKKPLTSIEFTRPSPQSRTRKPHLAQIDFDEIPSDSQSIVGKKETRPLRSKSKSSSTLKPQSASRSQVTSKAESAHADPGQLNQSTSDNRSEKCAAQTIRMNEQKPTTKNRGSMRSLSDLEPPSLSNTKRIPPARPRPRFSVPLSAPNVDDNDDAAATDEPSVVSQLNTSKSAPSVHRTAILSKKSKTLPWKDFNSSSPPRPVTQPIASEAPLSSSEIDDITMIQGDHATEARGDMKTSKIVKTTTQNTEKLNGRDLANIVLEVDDADKVEVSVETGRMVEAAGSSTGNLKPNTAKVIIEQDAGLFDTQTSSPTPGSGGDRGILEMKKNRVNSNSSIRHKSSHEASNEIPAADSQSPDIVRKRKHSALNRVQIRQETPPVNRILFSSPLVMSALKNKNGRASPAVRPRLSVTFADDHSSTIPAVHNSSIPERNTQTRASLYRSEPEIQGSRKYLPSVKVAPSVTPYEKDEQDLDRDWASDMLMIMNQIGEVVVESKRNRFKGVRHEVLSARSSIIENIQNALCQEVDVYARNYKSMVAVNAEYDCAGNQLINKYGTLGSENQMIYEQLQGTIGNHDKMSLSKRMVKQSLLGDGRSLGSTFAACGVTLE